MRNRFLAKKSPFLWENKKMIVQVAAFAFIFGWAVYGIGAVSGESTKQEMSNLEEAVRKDMTLCYALEGFYPATVTYMEEHYGLTYNKDKYVIDYEYTGSNLMPEVLIIER